MSYLDLPALTNMLIHQEALDLGVSIDHVSGVAQFGGGIRICDRNNSHSCSEPSRNPRFRILYHPAVCGRNFQQLSRLKKNIRGRLAVFHVGGGHRHSKEVAQSFKR
jgi:hypothetical protein